MVKIITGKINSTKTTKIKNHYLKYKTGDGIISKKVMIDKNVFGYTAVRLSDNLEFPLMIHDTFYKKGLYQNDEIFDKNICGQIGPYKIYQKGMKKVNAIYKELFKNKISPLYFDEIGKLEIQGSGFYKILKKAIKKDINLIITVREDLIEEIVDKLNISNYEIIGG